jgi:hypothetical protein
MRELAHHSYAKIIYARIRITRKRTYFIEHVRSMQLSESGGFKYPSQRRIAYRDALSFSYSLEFRRASYVEAIRYWQRRIDTIGKKKNIYIYILSPLSA